MGWTTTIGSTKKSIIAELTETWNCKDRRLEHNQKSLQETSYITYFNAECIKHCYRGNAYSGVLWAVWEWKMYDIHTDEHLKTERWIGCYLLKYYKRDSGWGYKDMDESMNPYYYSCPLGYLELAPVANEEWRKGVRAYHEKRTMKFEIGDTVKLFSTEVPYVTITSKKPLRGHYHGKQWRIPRNMIDKKLNTQELVELMA